MNRKMKNYRIAGMGLIVCIIIMLLICLGNFISNHRSVSSEVTRGTKYVQKQEKGDVEAIEQIRKEQRVARIQEKCEEILASLDDDPSAVWGLFEDYLLLGDSRAVGFYYYGCLPEENCITDGGATIRDHLEAHLSDIYAKNPASLILCYGLNDVSIGYWDTPEAYCEEYKGVLEEIHQNIPDTKIYISSILIARDPAFERSEKWRNIPDYNVALAAMCDTLDYVYYVDNTNLCDEYADLWDDVDGIHLKETFYPYWGRNIISEIYRSEIEDEDNTGSDETADSSDSGTNDAGSEN